MGHVERRGTGRWRARLRGPDGRERSRTFDRKADAERWLATSSADRIRGDWTDPKLGRLRFSEWVTTWEQGLIGLRPTTRALNLGVARNYLVPRFGDWPLARITTADVRAMVAAELATGERSISSVRRHAIVLSTILAAAVQDSRISRNPCDGVRLPAENARPMRFLEPEELAVVADAIRPTHYRALVLTAGYVGLRWGELAGLGVSSVNLLRRTVRVERQLVDLNGRLSYGPPKTKAGDRTVTMPAALVDILTAHLDTEPVRRGGLAFPSATGLPMRRANFRTVWRRACTAAGFDGGPLDGFVFHELRHTAAALAIAQGAHPLAIKERLGHSSITVTMDTYGGLFPRLDEAIAEGLDGVFRASFAASSRPDQREVVRFGRSAPLHA